LDFFEVGGAVSVRRNYLHGKIQGTAYGYYENGEISEETEYVNGKRHGFYREYYENGKIYTEETYLNGKRTSRKSYAEDENVVRDIRTGL